MSVEAPTDPAAAIDGRDNSVSRPLAFTLAGLVIIVAAIVVWALFGRAPQTISGFGYVVPDGGFTEVGTTVKGLVESIEVEPGQRVSVGEELTRRVEAAELRCTEANDRVKQLESDLATARMEADEAAQALKILHELASSPFGVIKAILG